MVDRHKRFLDVAVGMLGSTNEVWVLRRSALYWLAITTNQLFDVAYSWEGFSPYLIPGKGYPLYPWLNIPYRDLLRRNRSLQERFFNCKLSIGRCVVENAFGILKQSFWELGRLFELHMTSFQMWLLLATCCIMCCSIKIPMTWLCFSRFAYALTFSYTAFIQSTWADHIFDIFLIISKGKGWLQRLMMTQR